MLTEFYSELNPAQRIAVETLDGPVLVLAGPGTGKTQLLSIRAANILVKRSNVRPENILIVTYTNSAVKTIRERLVRIVGLKGYDVEVETFHSFANSIIQESEEAADYVGDKLQMTEIEQIKTIRYILDRASDISSIRPFRAPYLYLKDIAKRISELKKEGIRPEGLLTYVNDLENRGDGFDKNQLERLRALAVVYKMYEALKDGKDSKVFDARGRYDFDDMILFATEALKKEERLSDEYRNLYRFVMVDEYQDTNEAQLDFLFTLLNYREPNLCCVGDDDQSIYRFQGASVGNFKFLKERFPSIKVVTLKDNYRSTKEIIDFASSVIKTIPRHERAGDKTLDVVKDYADKRIEFREFTQEQEELLFIVEKVKEIRDEIERARDLDRETKENPYNNIAVLVRKRRDILKVIDAFLQAGIPYATDGKEDISGERRVKQLLDSLELATLGSESARHKDFLLYKVLSADYFKIGLADVIRFFNYANSKRRSEDSRKGCHRTVLEQFLEVFKFSETELSSNTIDFKALRDRFDILKILKIGSPVEFTKAAWAIARLLRDAHSRTVHAILLAFLNDAGLFKFILDEYASKKILRIRDLRSIASFVNMVKSADAAQPGIRLADFMEDLNIQKEHGIPIRGELVTMTQDGVRIFTAHSSKGMEFHTVFIPFCLENKNWPARPLAEKITLPADLFKTREKASDELQSKRLFLQDETRLFYVASTRAKSNLILTVSPQENKISSHYLKRLREDAGAAPIPPEREEALLKKSIALSRELELEFPNADEILRDMVRDIALNPTSLNNYLTCKRKFFYDDVLMLPGAKRQSLVFGNCVHKALEETYRLYKETDKFPDFKFFADSFKKELAFQGLDEAMEARISSQLDTLKGWFHFAARNPKKPIELEKKISVTVGDGIKFTGKLDKLELEDELSKLVTVVDYKTGRPDDHIKSMEECDDLASDECDGYLRQLISYKLLFERDKRLSKLYKMRHGELVFVEPLSKDSRKMGLKKGDYVNKKVAIGEDMVDAIERLIVAVWKGVNGLRFNKLDERDRDKCGHCDFDNICWG